MSVRCVAPELARRCPLQMTMFRVVVGSRHHQVLGFGINLHKQTPAREGCGYRKKHRDQGKHTS
jgi:hypothetical protein